MQYQVAQLMHRVCDALHGSLLLLESRLFRDENITVDLPHAQNKILQLYYCQSRTSL